MQFAHRSTPYHPLRSNNVKLPLRFWRDNSCKMRKLFYYFKEIAHAKRASWLFFIVKCTNLWRSCYLLKFIDTSLSWRRFGYAILNYHKIRRMFALNFSKNYKCFEKLHQTLERAFLRISKHFKVGLKNSAAPRFFQPTSQCLDIWWNTFPCVW